MIHPLFSWGLKDVGVRKEAVFETGIGVIVLDESDKKAVCALSGFGTSLDRFGRKWQKILGSCHILPCSQDL